MGVWGEDPGKVLEPRSFDHKETPFLLQKYVFDIL